MNNYIPSINESINAKNTVTSELCNTFIVNNYYNKLASNSHTIMMGPRGSGKTTLMRMLEVKSLELWESEASQYFRDTINFSGVFIPTDRIWKTQYENTSKKLKHIEDRYVLESQFTYHVLHQLALSVSFRTCRITNKKNKFRHTILDKKSESELVKELSELWIIKPKIQSLRSLITSLSLKKNEISHYLNNVILLDNSESRPDVINGEINNIIGTSIDIINTYLNEIGQKWAFLFDELELAPDYIIQPLIDNMRGGHPDIILKLALSPYHKGLDDITNSPYSSMKDQDLSFIDLTELSESEGKKFSEELCSNLFKKKGIFNSVESCFEQPKEIDIDIIFDSLVNKDFGFREYLDSKDFRSIKYTNAENKKSQFRKVKFIAYLRDYSKNDNGNLISRRRAADYYAGFDNICKSIEYNPRMLIGIMNMFIPIIKSNGKIAIHEQISGLKMYFDSFKALLSTIAIDSQDSRINNIYDLVDLIAIFFKNELYGERFIAEPKGMLTIDEETPQDLRDAIGFALNAGAMIRVNKNDENSSMLSKDRTLTCRLSYLFSHNYGLLLTKQRAVQLSKVMADQRIETNKVSLVDIHSNGEGKQLGLDLE